ncbi:MAG TPA: hypothetical protein VF559_01170 [Caulobacteraceae bacterium]|jgi:hypothetical protein
MTRTVTRLFDSQNEARQAVSELEQSRLGHADISLIANNSGASGEDRSFAPRDDDRGHEAAEGAAEGAGTGATLGGVVGGGAGLLAGLGMLAIPGIGPVAAAGWLTSTLIGAGAGAAAGGVTGGLIGALTNAGVSEDDAHVYAEGVRRGGALVAVRVDEEYADQAEQILSRFGGSDASSRGGAYRESGWSRFDESAQPYTSEQISQERGFYQR